jgi:hypothetical protein
VLTAYLLPSVVYSCWPSRRSTFPLPSDWIQASVFPVPRNWRTVRAADDNRCKTAQSRPTESGYYDGRQTTLSPKKGCSTDWRAGTFAPMHGHRLRRFAKVTQICLAKLTRCSVSPRRTMQAKSRSRCPLHRRSSAGRKPASRRPRDSQARARQRTPACRCRVESR